MTVMAKTRWIALLELYSLNDSKGAFCTAIAWVHDRSEFEELARTELHGLGYELVAMEELDKYAERIRAFEVSYECKQLAEAVSVDFPIRFCRFHRFDTTDE